MVTLLSFPSSPSPALPITITNTHPPTSQPHPQTGEPSWVFAALTNCDASCDAASFQVITHPYASSMFHVHTPHFTLHISRSTLHAPRSTLHAPRSINITLHPSSPPTTTTSQRWRPSQPRVQSPTSAARSARHGSHIFFLFHASKSPLANFHKTDILYSPKLAKTSIMLCDTPFDSDDSSRSIP